MPIATAMCSSFKAELMQGMHCFTATLTPTGNVTSGVPTISTMSSVANICRGMSISATQLPANCFVEDIPTAASITLSKNPTATATGATLTLVGDQMKMALIKVSPTGSYGAGTTNYSNVTANADEVTGTGYTAGGVNLTNVTPAVSGTTAIANFSPNPSWVAATFSTAGCMIYNGSTRGGTVGRAVSTHDFGGTQSVSGGTFTVILPPFDAANAILRIA
jgi:hypothetical protein